MIEKIVFNVVAIALFTIIFFKLIKKNDTSYIAVLAIEAIGIIINFIELFIARPFGLAIKILMYICSVILPLILIWLEKYKNLNFSELFCWTMTKILEKFNQHEKAKSILLKYWNKNKNSYIANKLLAEMYEKEENYEAAISAYRKAAELNKNNMEIYYKLAFVLNKGKQNEEAIYVLQDLLRKKPEDEKSSTLLFDIYFEEEKYKEAISVCMTALRYHPGSYDLYYSVGMAYTLLNDFQRAKEFYEKAAQINTMAYNAKLNLGQIALMYGDLDEAEKYFRESIKQNNLEAGSYYYLSEIALLKGDEEKAKNYMNIAIEIDPRVYKIMQKDPVFEPIKDKVNPPHQHINEQESNQKQKLSKKEKKVNEHLAKTCILIESLGSDALKKIREQNENEISEGEKQQEQE